MGSALRRQHFPPGGQFRRLESQVHVIEPRHVPLIPRRHIHDEQKHRDAKQGGSLRDDEPQHHERDEHRAGQDAREDAEKHVDCGTEPTARYACESSLGDE